MKLFRFFTKKKNKRVEEIPANDLLASGKHHHEQQSGTRGGGDGVGTVDSYEPAPQHRGDNDGGRGGTKTNADGRIRGNERDSNDEGRNDNKGKLGNSKTNKPSAAANSSTTPKPQTPIGIHREGRPVRFPAF